MSGKLKLRIVTQDNKLTVTLFELRGLIGRRDVANLVRIKVSITSDLLQKQRFKTKYVLMTPDPAIFNETFTLNVPEIDDGRRLLITVWQSTDDAKEMTGCMSFSVQKLLQRNKMVEGWYHLLVEEVGRKRHYHYRTRHANGNHRNGKDVILSRPQNAQPEIAINNHYQNYPRIGRSRQVHFQLNSQIRRESSCETVKTTQTANNVKRTTLRNASSLRRYDSEIRRSGTIRKHGQDRRSYIGRSPVRPKWRKPNGPLADSPKFVTDARIVKSYRSKSAKIITRRHQRLQLRANSSDVKVLYTDETACATHQSTSAATVSKDIGVDETPVINHCMNTATLAASKDQETGYLTLTDHPQVAKPTMTSGMQDQRDNKGDSPSDGDHLRDEPSLANLTVTKSGRVKERKQMRSPTFFRATHIGQANADNDRQTILEEANNDATTRTEYQKEHIYASIDEIRAELAPTRPDITVKLQQPISKTIVRRSKSSSDQLPSSPSKNDFNMNLTYNRKRNSNTDSGIFVQLESAEAETKVAELCSLNGENQKAAKLKPQSIDDLKINEKENKEPLPSAREADLPRHLTKGKIFSASAKRANKKSFRQPKKLSTCDPSKANELSLKELLKNKAALNAFREFLTSEHSTENLEFWLECESYKSVKESKMLKTAHGIFAKFLARSAPQEVNIELSVRNRTEERLKHIDRETFAEAQECIFNLMRTDSFRRFSTTDKYQALMESPDTFKILARLGSSRKK